MKSSYKKLGNYIQVVNKRDTNKTVDKLLGVSIRKVLIPSIANIIGTDMSTYKIIQKNQFAYGPVTSRNGDKISVALLEDYEEAIVSQAYTVFEVIDKNELLPEYLMMWFRRPEFDRYARFKSHGSAREIFGWDEMCDTELPIPSIEKQKEIVKEYHILVDRIELNNQLITKLEETAQAIYKQWFVDFEFPDENGLPYKSNGGEMVWCEELEKEIPEGWELKEINKLGYIKHGYAFKGENFVEKETQLVLISPGNFKINGGFNFEKNKFYKGTFPEDYTLMEDDLIFNMTDLSKKGDTLGNSALIPNVAFKKLLHNQRVGKFESINKENNYFLYFTTNELDYKQYILGTATGTTVRHTSPTRIAEFRILFPKREAIVIFNKVVDPMIKLINQNISMDYKLKQLKDLLLMRMTKVETEKANA
jgi:type I restriction enzyme S subunit